MQQRPHGLSLHASIRATTHTGRREGAPECVMSECECDESVMEGIGAWLTAEVSLNLARRKASGGGLANPCNSSACATTRTACFKLKLAMATQGTLQRRRREKEKEKERARRRQREKETEGLTGEGGHEPHRRPPFAVAPCRSSGC
jgi:hypothetical protein